MLSRRGLSTAILALVVAGAMAFFIPTAAAQEKVSLTVSAAISLKDALDEIGHVYEQGHPGVKVTLNYGGSGMLQHQIEQGAPVDIFFSAAEKEMDTLQSEGLIIPETRRDLLANQLVLIVPANSTSVKDFADLARPDVKVIALGEPATVPAGKYADHVLKHLGLLPAIEKKIVFAKDVRAVRMYVETGNADAGLVYRSDAQGSAKVRVVAAAPAGSHEPIRYPAAIIKQTKHEAAAIALLEFFSGAEAGAIFEKYGFVAPERISRKN